MSEQSKKQQRFQERRQQALKIRRRQQMTSTGLIVLGAVVLVGLLAYPSLKPEAPRQHPMADFNSMGDPNAPVTIVEYSDFLCSHCQDFARDTEPLLVEDYITSGKVYFTYRSFGEQYEFSGIAAEAAYCAGDQDKFWEMHDTLFLKPISLYSIGNLTNLAEGMGVDAEQFQACMENHTHLERVRQDRVDATAAGVRGTPSFIINGQFVEGNVPYENFQQIIDATLAALGE